MWYLVSPILIVVLLNTIFVNRSVVPLTLNVHPILFVISCKNGGSINLHCCNYCHLPSGCSSKFEDPWQSFITDCWHEKVGFWPMDELTHHPWKYLLTYSWDMLYEKLPCWQKNTIYMTLYTLFSIALDLQITSNIELSIHIMVATNSIIWILWTTEFPKTPALVHHKIVGKRFFWQLELAFFTYYSLHALRTRVVAYF